MLGYNPFTKWDIPDMEPDNTPVDKKIHLPKHHFFTFSKFNGGVRLDTPKAPAFDLQNLKGDKPNRKATSELTDYPVF